MKLFWAVVSVSISLGTLGCTSDPNVNLASVVEPNAKWSSSTLVTCFEDNGVDFTFSEEEKATIQTAISGQYTPEGTIVNFSGWKNCSETQNPNLTIQRGSPQAKSSVGISTIYDSVTGEQVGMGMGNSKKVKSPEGKISYIALASNEYAVATILFGIDAYCSHQRMKISKQECLRGLSLHEFGHVAGLRHEHIREEAAQDPLCRDSRSAHVFDDKREKFGETATFFDLPYDSRSVMNYCFMDAYENGTLPGVPFELSETDRLTLKRLYASGSGTEEQILARIQ